MNPTIDLPALYHAADAGSNSWQRRFLTTIRAEYIILTLLSLRFISENFFQVHVSILALAFLILSGLLIFKVFGRLDQKWYQCRALAESTKTLSWRYAMRAHPFEDAESVEIPRSRFRNRIAETIKQNRFLGEIISPDHAARDQITDEMGRIRALDLHGRKEIYLDQRIDDQRKWYAKKASFNARALQVWFTIGIVIYIAAFMSLFLESLDAEVLAAITDPLIVISTSLIGWIQIKRFSELSASYLLAAHEIGAIQSQALEISSEEALSGFVNDAETAFSREHTQWLARRDNL